jgi:hypothetical protein
MVVRWHYREPEPSFGIEAKILVASKIGSYKPWDTVDDYVAQGMKRFVEGKYGASLPTGAMIAYVLSGTPTEHAVRINERIAILPLACDHPLAIQASELRVAPNYESKYPRDNHDQIHLIHIFIDFEDE